MAKMIAENEIRMFLHKGLIQHIAIGQGIREDLIISVAENNLEHPVRNSRLEDDGFGNQCLFSAWKDADSECHKDENNITWV